MGFSIFIDSSIQMTSPSLTRLPTLTFTSVIYPARGTFTVSSAKVLPPFPSRINHETFKDYSSPSITQSIWFAVKLPWNLTAPPANDVVGHETGQRGAAFT